MSRADLPRTASWRHHSAREGFEVLRADPADDGGVVLRGHTTALEDGTAWSVGYVVTTAADFSTRRAEITALGDGGDRLLVLERCADGWTVDAVRRPDLDDCLDVDLEASAVTNTLPVHRLRMPVAQAVPAPAAYVRADLTVERLEQTYTRLDTAVRSFRYQCPAFEVDCTLTYDASGLVVDYPGLATRRS